MSTTASATSSTLTGPRSSATTTTTTSEYVDVDILPTFEFGIKQPLFRTSCVEDAYAQPNHQFPIDGLIPQHPMAPPWRYRAASSTTTPSTASTTPPTLGCALLATNGAPATSSVEEKVPVDTPTKCSMLVLNCGVYSVPNPPQASLVGSTQSIPSAPALVPSTVAISPLPAAVLTRGDGTVLQLVQEI